MGNVGFREYLNIIRPEKATIALFEGMPAAIVDDNMNRMFSTSPDIRQFSKVPLLGSAFTVRVPAGDNLMLHRALDIAEPGDILMVDARGGMERAIFGEIMVKYAIKRELGGIVVDGCIRDVDTISELDFPIYARGSSPNGPYKNGPGEINVPVCVGGLVVFPGDIVIGDCDGLVVIRQDDALEVALKAKAQSIKEHRDLDAIERRNYSNSGFNRAWILDLLKEKGCQFH